MKGSEIRKEFLGFFRKKDHTIVRSSPLIPVKDPSLLFTNAGMVQFKSIFLGIESRPYKRAVSCQKCMRAGGKHSDLESVGHTARHHTFFEMLGNFSFGDYFKREAIMFAWEFLTDVLRLPRERLWVSVYEEDNEAERLWIEETGIPSTRIVRLGAKDNFWQMGDTGPCGPCSEIIIDQGEDLGCGKPNCSPGCDCDRFLELWNLVFMQYNRESNGRLTPLPHPSIDTGMGLERITAVIQGKKNNFDSDIFENIIMGISSITGTQYHSSSEKDVSIRVIADHIRAIVFLMSEGLMPSNEGRGYVLRRIIRRASRHAMLLGMEKPVLSDLVDIVINDFKEIYPEVKDNPERVKRFLSLEEERFIKTLEQGTKILDGIISGLKTSGMKTVPGEEIFRLYDTYGFPLDLARDIALDAGMVIDEDGFHKEMEHQRHSGRRSWRGEEEGIPDLYREIINDIKEVIFTGYERMDDRGKVITIIKDGKSVDILREGEEAIVIFDRTPFYGESGGQVGDKGVITGAGLRGRVKDTKRPLPQLIFHYIKMDEGILRRGDEVELFVDEDKRRATMRNHTATHLLHSALRNVLGAHIRQAGSLVEPERLRFDFTHPYALNNDEKKEIELMINNWIVSNKRVIKKETSLDEALKEGTIALFDEKYGEKVRVVSVEGISKELCGGTHVDFTGDIGLFVIVSEESVASGIRRIEALTGINTFYYLRGLYEEILSIKRLLNTDKPYERLQKVFEEQKNMEKEIETLRLRNLSMEASKALENVKELNGIKVLSLRLDGLREKDLRILGDNIRERIKSGVIVLASVNDGQASLLTMVTRDLTRRFSAGDILREISAIAGGRGGGKADMAMGGTKDISRIDTALESVYKIIKNKIS